MPDFIHPIHGRVHNVAAHMGYSQAEGWQEVKPQPLVNTAQQWTHVSFAGLPPGSITMKQVFHGLAFAVAVLCWALIAVSLKTPRFHYVGADVKLIRSAVFCVPTVLVIWAAPRKSVRLVFAVASALVILFWIF